MRHSPDRGFLHVVGGQVVVLGGALFLIITPRGGRVRVDLLALVCGQRFFGFVAGFAGIDRKRQQHCEYNPRKPRKTHAEIYQICGGRDCGPEPFQINAPSAAPLVRLCGGRPVQHPPAGYKPEDSADRGVK